MFVVVCVFSKLDTSNIKYITTKHEFIKLRKMIKVGVYFKTVYKMFVFVAFTWFETTTTHILKHIHELKDTTCL